MFFQAQLVVDWLETCSKHESKLLSQPSIVHFTDKTVAWENTLCQLNGGIVNFGTERVSTELVTTIDPDCIYREEGRILHFMDSTNDSRLIKQVNKGFMTKIAKKNNQKINPINN